MKLQTVTWGRTKSVNYQSQRAEVTIALEKGDTFESALDAAKVLVDVALGEVPSKADIENAQNILRTAQIIDTSVGKVK